MSHSHLALQHLIKKIESPEYRRTRSAGPEWLPEFVDQVAELFEPFVDVGRVGYECAAGEDRWEISMYLGGTEMVGGKADGKTQPVAFQYNLLSLPAIFESVDAFYWNAFPAGTFPEGTDPRDRSFLSVTGRVRQSEVRLRVFCTAPDESGPGMRQYPDGTWEPA
ncbi:MAG: hypothetical protein EXS05_24295 [Planctomycetaceae bacterium]|nr:hypothetical protein [Planctomycetaceae bacterium]